MPDAPVWAKITTLDFQNRNIEKLPQGFEKLTNLQGLDLRGNYLTTLPESIGQLTNLQWLNLNETPVFAPYNIYLSGEELKTFLQKLSKGEIIFGK